MGEPRFKNSGQAFEHDLNAIYLPNGVPEYREEREGEITEGEEEDYEGKGKR